MKTTILLFILSTLSLLGNAQTKPYYLKDDTLKVKNTRYITCVERNQADIKELGKYKKNYTSRTKDGKEAHLEPMTGTCNYDRTLLQKTVQSVLNKYGHDCYSSQDEALKNRNASDNSFTLIIDFNTDTKKVESIMFSFININKASHIPIVAYDEINKKLTKLLTCEPNSIGETLQNCRSFYWVYVK